jgi:hypothetical protein
VLVIILLVMKKNLTSSLLLTLTASQALTLGATYQQWRGVREPSLRTLTLREWADADYSLLGEWQEAEALLNIQRDEEARLEALVEVSGDLPHPLADLWRPWFEVV